jgi:hypothetical protein
MVIGNAGGEKSTLCGTLGAAHSLPYYAIDKIQWKPDWVATPEPEFTRAHEALLSEPRASSISDRRNSWRRLRPIRFDGEEPALGILAFPYPPALKRCDSGAVS